MIKLEMPKVRATLYGLCRKMLNGIKRFSSGAAPAIPLKATSKDAFSADYAADVQAEDDFQVARALATEAIGARKAVEAQVNEWIGDAKARVFRKLWGTRWSVPYAQIGFKSGSIETPADTDGKLEVLRGIAAWLARNADKEVTTDDLVITSARGTQLETALDAAVNKVEACKIDMDAKDTARTATAEQIKGRLRLVAEELDFVLDPLDARWTAYGLNKPGERERPGLVTGVQASLPSPKHLHLTWEPSERVVRYKVRALVVGKETEFRTVAEVYEEQADLTTFAAGEVVRLEIVAINGAGESGAERAGVGDSAAGGGGVMRLRRCRRIISQANPKGMSLRFLLSGGGTRGHRPPAPPSASRTATRSPIERAGGG